jgi:hypothetical protein
VHGNNTKKFPVQLSLSQTSKKAMFLFLSFVFASTKLENRKAEQILPKEVGGLALVGGGRWWGKV